MRSWGLVLAVAASACARSNAEHCADGTLCPEGMLCVIDEALPDTRCVPPGTLEACEGRANGEACAAGVGETGTCFGGACFPQRCGDLLRDRGEACDDGNLASGDGCSATCDSVEMCGDRVVDPRVGEQCDDRTPLLAGDGCTATCVVEYRIWHEVSPPRPSTGGGYAIATDPVEGLLAFGGINSNGGLIDDTWRWTGATWMPANAASTVAPSRRQETAMAYDPVRKRVVLFGGEGVNGNLLADTWEWDGYRWEQLQPAMSPPARSAAAMACGGGRCVLVGGVSDSNVMQCSEPVSPLVPAYVPACDAWAWDGITWTRIPTAPTYEARAYPAFAYHAGLQRFVLFGGLGKSGVGTFNVMYDDTWELAGTAWTEKLYVIKPLGGLDLSAASDGNNVLLVSGNNTWTYTGSAWTNHNSAYTVEATELAPDRQGVVTLVGMSPPSTRLFALTWSANTWVTRVDWRPDGGVSTTLAVYDLARARTIVIDRTAGTLAWDTVGWRQLAKVTPGPQLYGSQAVYDARCGTVIVVGGVNNSSESVSDLFRLRSENSVVDVERCLADLDEDADGAAGCADPDCWARCTPLCPPGLSCPAGPRCGDGACQPPREDPLLCPSDCSAP